MGKEEKTRQELLLEIEELRARLEEAEETLRAIRSGEVDAVIVSGPQGEQVYTLKGADHTYRLLIEQMKEGAATLAADGTILYCNRRLGDMLQMPLEQVIGSSIYGVVAPADWQLCEALLQQGSQGAAKGELAFCARDGTRVPVHISASALHIEDVQVLCTVVTDLTEQKRHEEIVAAERLARSILDQAAEVIVVCDEEGQIIRASQMAYQLCGQNPMLQPFETVFPFRIGSIRRVVSEESLPSGEDVGGEGEPFSLVSVLRGERFQGVEAGFVRPDGQRFNLLVNAGPLRGTEGQMLGCVITLTDITERVQTEEALWESEQWLYTTLRSIGDGVIATDVKGLVTLMNSVAEDLTGWDEGDAWGRPLEDVFNIINEQTREPAENPVARVLREGVVVGLANHTILVAKDGTKRALADSAAPIKDQEGNIIGVVIVFRDITERRQAEQALRKYSEQLEEMVQERTQELREAQEELVRNEKLAVLGQLAGGVSHELRSPLGMISSAAYYLSRLLKEPQPDVKETLEILTREVRVSERIIASLLDFARTETPIRRKVDLNKVIRETLSQAAVPHSVEVVCQLDESLPTIQADPEQLSRVFGNMILNAIEAMPEGGRLVVESKIAEPGWMAVSFKDTGVGISEENLGKIFEPLFTTKTRGLGLGLALAKILAKGHDGTIEAESAVGTGSTFTVRLPATGESTPSPSSLSGQDDTEGTEK